MKRILLLTLLSIAIYGNAMAKGIPIPYCSNCEYITVVADLPDNSQFYSEEYKGYLDIGYKYNQFWLLWLPIWNSNGEYCLTIKGQDIYFDITTSELQKIAKANSIELSSNPIPLWDKIGGKAVILALLGLVIWSYFSKGKKKNGVVATDEKEDDKDEDEKK